MQAPNLMYTRKDEEPGNEAIFPANEKKKSCGDKAITDCYLLVLEHRQSFVEEYHVAGYPY